MANPDFNTILDRRLALALSEANASGDDVAVARALNGILARLDLPLGTTEQGMTPEAAEQVQAFVLANEPHLVVCFGMLSYKVLSRHMSKQGAKAELARWRTLARKGEAEVLPLYRKGKAHPNDFDVRKQSDLDELTRAILGSYE